MEPQFHSIRDGVVFELAKLVFLNQQLARLASFGVKPIIINEGLNFVRCNSKLAGNFINGQNYVRCFSVKIATKGFDSRKIRLFRRWLITFPSPCD